MNILIKTKNLALTEALEVFINEKVGKLEKFLPEKTEEILVELQKESLHHRKGDVFLVEIMLELFGKKLMASAKGSDANQIIIEAKDEMEILIKKNKTKKIQEPRRKIQKANGENE